MKEKNITMFEMIIVCATIFQMEWKYGSKLKMVK